MELVYCLGTIEQNDSRASINFRVSRRRLLVTKPMGANKNDCRISFLDAGLALSYCRLFMDKLIA